MELKTYLISICFVNSLADTSLFILKHGHVYLLVYVDDILVMGSSSVGIKKILTLLAKMFSVKDHE